MWDVRFTEAMEAEAHQKKAKTDVRTSDASKDDSAPAPANPVQPPVVAVATPVKKPRIPPTRKKANSQSQPVIDESNSSSDNS